MSENRVSITAKVPLTAQQQWETFMTDHCARWQGVLVRYDAAGQVLDILDSVRSLIPSDARQTVTHSLDFRSRMTETVTQRQWVLTLGNPLIIHPADPDASLLFNPHSPDTMVGGDRTGQGVYFEPYLLASGKRTSVVVMYASVPNSPQPNKFSFFREIKEEAAEPWWSQQTHCRIDRVNGLKLPAQTTGGTYVSEQTINSDVIIACIDTFFAVVERPTVIVVDQASIHTSNAIFEKIEEWKERGLTIFELPTYSPELNLIEILWRFIKYQWLEIDAYSSWQSLVSSVEIILKEVGDNYVINFA